MYAIRSYYVSKQINEDAGEVVKKILEDPKVQEKVNELRDKLKSSILLIK